MCSCTRYNAWNLFPFCVSRRVPPPFTPLPEQIRFDCRGSPFISIRNEVTSFSLALGIGWCRHEAGRKADRAFANKPAFQSMPVISPPFVAVVRSFLDFTRSQLRVPAFLEKFFPPRRKADAWRGGRIQESSEINLGITSTIYRGRNKSKVAVMVVVWSMRWISGRTFRTEGNGILSACWESR